MRVIRENNIRYDRRASKAQSSYEKERAAIKCKKIGVEVDKMYFT